MIGNGGLCWDIDRIRSRRYTLGSKQKEQEVNCNQRRVTRKT